MFIVSSFLHIFSTGIKYKLLEKIYKGRLNGQKQQRKKSLSIYSTYKNF